MFEDAEVIYSYSTEEAIADGVLIDLDQDPKLVGPLRNLLNPSWRAAITTNLRARLDEEAQGDDARLHAAWQRILAGWVAAVRHAWPGATLVGFEAELQGEPTRILAGVEGWSMADPTPKLTFMLPEDD